MEQIYSIAPTVPHNNTYYVVRFNLITQKYEQINGKRFTSLTDAQKEVDLLNQDLKEQTIRMDIIHDFLIFHSMNKVLAIKLTQAWEKCEAFIYDIQSKNIEHLKDAKDGTYEKHFFHYSQHLY